MGNRDYWLCSFTGESWRDFQESGSKMCGFRASRWETVEKVSPGDYLLCYLMGVSRFIGVLRVTSEPLKDERPNGKENPLPCRLAVKPLIELRPETAIPVIELMDSLSFFRTAHTPHACP